MLSKRDLGGYNLVEIEMILNYFPHSVWTTEDQFQGLRKDFYQPIFDAVEAQTQSMDSR